MNFITNNVLWTKKVKPQQHQQQNQTYKSCQSRNRTPGTLAPHADALPLHHRVN